MQLCWLLFVSVFSVGTLATEKNPLTLQRPALIVTRDTFVDQSLDEDEIMKLLGIKPQSSTRVWIEEHSRGLQLGFELFDLLLLIGVATLSVLQLADIISVNSSTLWGSNTGLFSASLLSEPVLIVLLGTLAKGKLKFCSCVTTIFKFVGVLASLTMLASRAIKSDARLDEHTALILASSSAIFSTILVVGKFIMAFEPSEDLIQQVHQIN